MRNEVWGGILLPSLLLWTQCYPCPTLVILPKQDNPIMDGRRNGFMSFLWNKYIRLCWNLNHSLPVTFHMMWTDSQGKMQTKSWEAGVMSAKYWINKPSPISRHFYVHFVLMSLWKAWNHFCLDSVLLPNVLTKCLAVLVCHNN